MFGLKLTFSKDASTQPSDFSHDQLICGYCAENDAPNRLTMFPSSASQRLTTSAGSCKQKITELVSNRVRVFVLKLLLRHNFFQLALTTDKKFKEILSNLVYDGRIIIQVLS